MNLSLSLSLSPRIRVYIYIYMYNVRFVYYIFSSYAHIFVRRRRW